MFTRVVTAAILMLCLPALAHALAVSTTLPAGNASNVSRSTAISITFDVALQTSSITQGGRAGG